MDERGACQVIALVLWALAQCPEMSPEEMDDIQNHAEANLRLQAGVVLRPEMEWPSPPWAFAPMATTNNPFEE